MPRGLEVLLTKVVGKHLHQFLVLVEPELQDQEVINKLVVFVLLTEMLEL